MKKIFLIVLVFIIFLGECTAKTMSKKDIEKKYVEIMKKLDLEPAPMKLDQIDRVKDDYIGAVKNIYHCNQMEIDIDTGKIAFLFYGSRVKYHYKKPENILSKDELFEKGKEYAKIFEPNIDFNDYKLYFFKTNDYYQIWDAEVYWIRKYNGYLFGYNDVINISYYLNGEFEDYKNWCFSDTCETTVKLNTEEARISAIKEVKKALNGYHIYDCKAKVTDIRIININNFLKNHILISPKVTFNPKTRLSYYVEMKVKLLPDIVYRHIDTLLNVMNFSKLNLKVNNFFVAIDAATGKIIAGGGGNIQSE